MSRHVLTVDDNPLNLKLIEAVLRIDGHEVVSAATADEAIAMAVENPPSLILMDVDLPGMDGLEATRRLKADPRTSHVPVLAITAYAMPADRERALAAGCDDHLTKPLDTRALGDVVARHLGRDGGA